MNKVTKYFPIMILVGALGGCATRTHTVSTETHEVPPNAVVETKSETTETHNESGGVLSSSVDVVGEVIALPFRAVGALFRAIF